VCSDQPTERRSCAASPAGQPSLDAFLTYRLHRVNKLTDRDTLRAYQHECKLPLGEGRALAAIGSFAPMSVNHLARAANLDKAQASRSAQALVERGLVHKTASAADGRGVVLSLTPAGVARHGQVMAMIARRNHEIFSCLTPQERLLLGEWLDRITRHLLDADED